MKQIQADDCVSKTRAGLSKAEVAYSLGVSLRTVDYLIARRQLKAFKLGRRVIVPATEIARLMRTAASEGGK